MTTMLRPGDSDYDSELAGFQTAVSRRPDVIVAATSAADVVEAVRYAGEHDLPVAVHSTGHGVGIPFEGGVLVTTQRMTGIRIDAGIARVDAGVRWGAVIEAAAEHGLAPLSGSFPGVGVVGYTLGGGFSLLGRKYGLAADQVTAIEVVTADGELRRATPDTEKDLFWALRGGRDNFGIVTALEFRLVPVTRLYGGSLQFGTASLATVIRAWRDWAAEMPREMTSSLAMVPMPDLPVVPEPLRGQHVAQIRIAYLGDAAEGERLVAPLRAAAETLGDTLAEIPFTESGKIANEPPFPHGYRADNATVSELNDTMLDAILEHAGPDAPVPTVVLLDLLGGALSDAPEHPGVGWDREARFTVRALSVVDHAAIPEIRAAHGKLFDALKPWSTGKLLTFVYGESGADEEASKVYSPADLRRLTGIKAAVDPANRFRLTHNVEPARDAG
ncbi:FAD-binding oxidoreductase [Amycolatopsis sp. BJA-103]|uniref:FAD-binding oxidoreductase n=1 Tax=Amycolatopsis sp. BJA-103 TaxID=1911175 RepID=UPI000C75BEAD|nr:FAD-binding oxidoreductase [Amycolatopsis sp. BJA-103]AUI61820.1 FAD-binding oxidoreductase [Amycolatopsis sp. BJA-103]PNE20881.1 FAD-binding oxidoreductase [Amycolatopsis sp. BJA-103]